MAGEVLANVAEVESMRRHPEWNRCASVKKCPAMRFNVVVTVPEWRHAIVVDEGFGAVVGGIPKTIFTQDTDSGGWNGRNELRHEIAQPVGVATVFSAISQARLTQFGSPALGEIFAKVTRAYYCNDA